ncbi:MAG: hypoxanthine phosphoribosyltransferase [Armatimonadetes bacterium]|nr:hypoxanthine phosphoribosyltransferase [Armatimonadota bacterium]
MNADNCVIDILISEERLRERVRELGEEISRDYAPKPLLLIGILKGSAVFLADLLRCIDLTVDYDFVAVSSYGGEKSSSGVVRILKDTDAEVAGRDILIVEDIVDTGWTLRMSYLVENLLARNAASVKLCALLDKPGRRRVDIMVDYCGFQIDDEFVVGYGLDYEGRYRNLPYVGALKPEC